MSLAKALENTWSKNEYCPVTRLYNSLSDEDKKTFDNAIKNDIPHAVLVRALRVEGFKIGKETIAAHFNNQCRCPKK